MYAPEGVAVDTNNRIIVCDEKDEDLLQCL
ncbi:hypothetical protein [Salmonella sp. s55004]